MRYSVQQLDGLIDLMVDAVLREVDAEGRRKNADESGQEQRRREDPSSARLHRSAGCGVHGDDLADDLADDRA